MNKGIACNLFVITSLLTVFLLMPGHNFVRAEPRTLFVPGDYNSVQVAIIAANPGDTVLVRDCMVPGNLVVNKSISLIAERSSSYYEETRSEIEGGNCVVTISADNVTLCGFFIQKGNYGAFDTGINLVNVNNCNISDNIISGNNIGINLFQSSNNTISGNRVEGNGDGFDLDYASNNKIAENLVSNNDRGFFLCYSKDNVIYHNVISNNSIQQDVYELYETPNAWDDGYPSGGNYWSDFACNGNPSNGSRWYVLASSNVDRYPFQDPYRWDKTPPSIGTPYIVADNGICVNVTDETGISSVVLSYSIDGGLSWTNETMLKGSDLSYTYCWWIGSVSAGIKIDYKITAHDNASNFAIQDNVVNLYTVPEFPISTVLIVFMAAILITVIAIRSSARSHTPPKARKSLLNTY